jgi:hypothetical protein
MSTNNKKPDYWQKRCYKCRKIGHHKKRCLVNENWWEKQLNDKKNTDDIPNIFNLSSKSSIKYDGIYILHIPFSLIKHEYIVGKNYIEEYTDEYGNILDEYWNVKNNDPKFKEYFNLVLDKNLVLLNKEDEYNYRYLLSVINLINNPRIFYFILKYFPNILEQKIRVFGNTYSSMYNGETFNTKLIDFLKNKKCYHMYDNISP